MSAATVRAQLQAFLASPPIPGLETVFLSQPWFVDGGEWSLATNDGCGAIGWPWISDESEDRITLGAQFPGATAVGQKQITYKVTVVLLFKYLIPATVTSEDAWQGPVDAIIDAVKARLRSDPKAGTAPGLDGVIFQQSQEPGDLSVMRDLPQRDGDTLHIWQSIGTTVTEIITA